MIELMMHTVKNDMEIHNKKSGMMILVVESEYVSMIVDGVDKVTGSFDGLQLEEVDLKSLTNFTSIKNLLYPKGIVFKTLCSFEIVPTLFTIDDDAFDLGGSHDNKFADKVLVGSDEIQAKEDSRTLMIFSHNVWFAEDMELRIRMRAIGDIIQLHSPDIICLQVL
nr:endonuclease/exonuclease/phosphatase family protein [Tanacetum cinerariifolium]